jgi:hypothetical protein
MSPTGREHSDVTGDLYATIRIAARKLGGLVTLPDTGFRFIRPVGANSCSSPTLPISDPRESRNSRRAGAWRAADTSLCSPTWRSRSRCRTSIAPRWRRRCNFI